MCASSCITASRRSDSLQASPLAGSNRTGRKIPQVHGLTTAGDSSTRSDREIRQRVETYFSVSAHAPDWSGRALSRQRIRATWEMTRRISRINAPDNHSFKAKDQTSCAEMAAGATALDATSIVFRQHPGRGNDGKRRQGQDGNRHQCREQQCSGPKRMPERRGSACQRPGSNTRRQEQAGRFQCNGSRNGCLEHDQRPLLRASAINASSSSSSSVLSLRRDEPSKAAAAWAAEPSKKVSRRSATAFDLAFSRATTGE